MSFRGGGSRGLGLDAGGHSVAARPRARPEACREKDKEQAAVGVGSLSGEDSAESLGYPYQQSQRESGQEGGPGKSPRGHSDSDKGAEQGENDGDLEASLAT